MRKVIIGLLCAAVVAVGGYFGLEYYLQWRIAGDVDAAFAAVRNSGAKATHGKIRFDLWSRTIRIADISGEFSADPPSSVKIGGVIAAGVRRQDGGRISADRIEASDVDLSAAMGALRTRYQVPRIEVSGYSGPAGPVGQPASPAPADIYRFALEHFAAVSAASVVVPSVMATFAPKSTSAPGPTGDYTYSGIAVRDIRDGKIASSTIEKVAFIATMTVGAKPENFSGEINKIAAYDFDTTATLAMLDPAHATDDRYYRVYRQMTVGPYTASLQQGLKMRMEGASMVDVGLRPSRLQLPQLMAIVQAAPQAGTAQTLKQMRALLGQFAGLYEGIRIGGAELRGLSVETPQGPFNIGAFKLANLENGKIGEFAVEGLEAKAPQGPVKIGRFALKGLDVANLMRTSAQFARTMGDPSADQLAALIPLLEGVEISRLVAPYKNTGNPVNVDTLNISWGQFVGPLPTRAGVTLKISGPVEASDPDPFNLLAAAGIADASLNFDLGAGWTESTHTFAVEPATIDVGSVGDASVRLSLANVAREVFSLNPLQLAIMAAQIEAGPIEIKVHDAGGIDLVLTRQARQQNISPDDARKAITDNIREAAAQMATDNPDVTTISDALVHFIETPRGTLTIKLTPKGKVPVMELLDATKETPLAVLARFQVEATMGR